MEIKDIDPRRPFEIDKERNQKDRKPKVEHVHVLWITQGLGCDGDTISITAASNPSLEDLLMGNIPGLPKVTLHNPVLAYANGEEFLKPFHDAADGKLDPFVLVVEGSIPNEEIHDAGYFAAFGNGPDGQPIKTTDWIDRLAPKATAIVAAGTCATFGGIHAMKGNPTGCMGLADHLGWSFLTKAGYPIVNVPGCPVQPDNFMETFLYLLRMLAGTAPLIPLDLELRPKWLFERTVHEGCDRGGYYEEGSFASSYGKPECLVRKGCWGPVVQCNVTKRGWINGLGGCPNVGGICIACTMPRFPDKYMPFMDEPPGAGLSSNSVVMYGKPIRALRQITLALGNVEPRWRRRGPRLRTGYEPATRAARRQS